MIELSELADAGDFAGVVERLISLPGGTYFAPDLDQLLRRAVRRASQQTPDKFTDATFRQTVAFVAYLQCRVQICAFHSVSLGDRSACGPLDKIPDELTRDLVPHVVTLGRLIGELAQAWATTTRKRTLAARSGKKGGHATGKRHRGMKPTTRYTLDEDEAG